MLFKDKKQKSKKIHRLVAETFIKNIKNDVVVNHKDGNKLNNCVDNLEWCTPQHNIKEAFRIGLNKHIRGANHHLSKQVKQLDLQGNLIKKWNCMKDIERELGFKHSCISICCNKKHDKMYGYRWEYVEYIEKDKIKNKIEELKKIEDYPSFTIKVLQELLEESEDK